MSKRGDEIGCDLEAARAGSMEALGKVLDAFRGYLLLIAQQELPATVQAKGGASDLVQETFLKAHWHLAQFHGSSEAELRAWLRRLLLNNLADFHRHYRDTEKRQSGREVSLGMDESGQGPAASLASALPTPSKVAIGHEQAADLERVLARLPEFYREVLLLRHRDECSFEEIGRRLDRSANAARKLWARAVERFQLEWEETHAASMPRSPRT